MYLNWSWVDIGQPPAAARVDYAPYQLSYDKLNDQVSYQLITYHYDVMIWELYACTYMHMQKLK